MRRFNLLLISASVAGWTIAFSLHTAAQPASQGVPSPNVAAPYEALIRRHANNIEIVTFADRRLAPVRVVRGTGLPARPVAPAPLAVPSAAGARPPTRPQPQVVSFADQRQAPVTVLRGMPAAGIGLPPPSVADGSDIDLFAAAGAADLDRVAFAVDGAESSHGADLAMWRPQPDGPQGPMQVSAAAAADSGGGDRFDLAQNRQLGRAYLARLHRRYGNWPDAVAAYNWGPGNLDLWIAGGRPPAGLPVEVAHYRDRVLGDGGRLAAPEATATPPSALVAP